MLLLAGITVFAITGAIIFSPILILFTFVSSVVWVTALITIVGYSYFSGGSADAGGSLRYHHHRRHRRHNGTSGGGSSGTATNAANAGPPKGSPSGGGGGSSGNGSKSRSSGKRQLTQEQLRNIAARVSQAQSRTGTSSDSASNGRADEADGGLPYTGSSIGSSSSSEIIPRDHNVVRGPVEGSATPFPSVGAHVTVG